MKLRHPDTTNGSTASEAYLDAMVTNSLELRLAWARLDIAIERLDDALARYRLATEER